MICTTHKLGAASRTEHEARVSQGCPFYSMCALLLLLLAAAAFLRHGCNEDARV
jgi:hypothetical protein